MSKQINYLTQAQAAKLVGLTRGAINNKARLKKIPSWLVKLPGRKELVVDVESDEFLEYVAKSKKRKLKVVPSPGGKAAAQKKDTDPELTLEEAELERMRLTAKAAKYADEIATSKMKHFKLEQEILKLKREAGDLVTWKEADQLYFGYMSRINLKILGSAKRQEKNISQFVADEIIRDFELDSYLDIEQLKGVRKKLKISSLELAKKIIKLITRDNEAELEQIRRLQEKEVIKWQDSLKQIDGSL